MTATRRLTPARPWAPLTDAEWGAIAPFLPPAGPRQPPDLPRRRLDAVFRVAVAFAPWRSLPEAMGKPETIARHFRRLTDQGVWERLLIALAQSLPEAPLRAVEFFVCRASRRAARRRGLPFLALIRGLGLHSALPAPPWLLPDPALAAALAEIAPADALPASPRGRRRAAAAAADLRRLQRIAAGARRIPRSVRLAWP